VARHTKHFAAKIQTDKVHGRVSSQQHLKQSGGATADVENFQVRMNLYSVQCLLKACMDKT
jgi:hypothetical protein